MAFQFIGPDQYLAPQGPNVGSTIANVLLRVFQMQAQRRAEEERRAQLALEARRVAEEERRGATLDEAARLRLDEARREQDVAQAGEKLASVPGVVGGAGAEPLVKLPLLPPTLATSIGSAAVRSPSPDAASTVETPNPDPGAVTGFNVGPGPLPPAMAALARFNQTRMAAAEARRQKQEDAIAGGEALRVTEDMHGALPPAFRGLFPVGSIMPKALAVQAVKPAAKQVERTVDLGNRVQYIYTDGTTKVEPKGAAPKAAGESTAYDFESDVHTGANGQQWLDATGYKGKQDQAAARTYATKQGIKFINDAKVAGSLAGSMESRQDLDRIFGEVVPALPKGPATRLPVGVKNWAEAVLQTNPELAAFDSNWESFVRAALNVIPAGRGFRMNEAEMRRIMSANRPSFSDTQATALKKKANITAAFDSLEAEVLGAGRSKAPGETGGGASETRVGPDGKTYRKVPGGWQAVD